MTYHTFKNILFTDPYEFEAGCERGRSCNDGHICVSKEKCASCSFGECVQHAKYDNAEGFAYSSAKICRLCLKGHPIHILPNENWGVYTKRGAHQNYIRYM